MLNHGSHTAAPSSMDADSHFAVVSSIMGRINGFLYRCRNDSSYTMLYISDGVREVSGYPAIDFINNNVRDFASLIHPHDLSAVVTAVEAALKDRKNWELDYRIARQDGSFAWMHEIGAGVFDERGDLKYLEGFIINVDERKRIELELQQTNKHRETTQRLLASVFGVISEPLAVAGPHGNLKMANTAVTRRLGWSIFDLMGKPITNLVAEADRPAIAEMMAAGSALDQTRQTKCMLRIKGKDDRPGEVDLTSIIQPDGQMYHVLTLRPQKDSAIADTDWNFELAVREAMKGGRAESNIVAGKLQLVGLDELKETLGDKWPAISDRAFSVAERAIKRHLRPGDVFRKTTEDGYLVLFAHLSENEAQFKARAIADEIREKLTGEIPDLAEAKVASITAAVPIESEQQTEESIIAAIERRLREERERTENDAKEALVGGLRKAQPVFANAMTAAGTPAPIMFAKLPVVMKDADDTLRALGINHLALEAESFLLAGAGQRVLGGLSKSVGELIFTPVRLQTLAQHRASEAWLEVARTLGEAAKRQIVVELREVPKDVATSRIADTVQRLASLFKAVAVELPEADFSFVEKLPSQVRLLTVEYARIPWAGDTALSANFVRMIKVIDAKQRRLIVRNVTSIRRRNLLANAGINLYLD